MEKNTPWSPPTSDDMRSGLSFGAVVLFVGAGFLVIVLLGYFLVPWGSIFSSTKDVVTEATKQVEQQKVTAKAVEQAVEKIAAQPASEPVVESLNLPPTRGFVVFRGTVVLLDKVDARISNDRKKVILLLNPKTAGDTGNIPALGIVLAFKNAANGCSKEDLDKYQLRIDMKPFNVGGERVIIIDRNPASDFNYQIEELNCERKAGGEVNLHMVGSSDIYDSDNISWSFVLKGKLQ